jgi:ubiquinone/menaquinone biosynthesis C-methylase UbiE/acyl carrier protein
MKDIQNWLVDWFKKKKPITELDITRNYFEAGLIDSLDVIDLIESIESHFKIKFNEMHFQDRNFSTIEGLSHMISDVLPKTHEIENTNMAKGWAACYQIYKDRGHDLCYPSETLIRLLKGTYLTGQHLSLKGQSVLDVGFGNGNNFPLYYDMGLKVSGVEIHQQILQQARETFQSFGSLDLRIGTNQELPYDDNHFDFLVSWNVLHYEAQENGIIKSLKEYARVLKPTGRLLLSTTGPDHLILNGAKKIGQHQNEITVKSDFRCGQVHFNFGNKDYIEYYFQSDFKGLKIGRVHDALFDATSILDWWIITGIKK